MAWFKFQSPKETKIIEKGNQEKRHTCKTGGRTALLSVQKTRQLWCFFKKQGLVRRLPRWTIALEMFVYCEKDVFRSKTALLQEFKVFTGKDHFRQYAQERCPEFWFVAILPKCEGRLLVTSRNGIVQNDYFDKNVPFTSMSLTCMRILPAFCRIRGIVWRQLI